MYVFYFMHYYIGSSSNGDPQAPHFRFHLDWKRHSNHCILRQGTCPWDMIGDKPLAIGRSHSKPPPGHGIYALTVGAGAGRAGNSSKFTRVLIHNRKVALVKWRGVVASATQFTQHHTQYPYTQPCQFSVIIPHFTTCLYDEVWDTCRENPTCVLGPGRCERMPDVY